MKTITKTLVASTTYTATVTTDAIELQEADAYTFHLKSDAAGAGTNPTLNVAMKWTYDGGTTYVFAPIRFAEVTSVASEQEISFRPTIAQEGAWHSAVGATGGALAKNFVPSRKVKFVFTVGGTSSPSFANVVLVATYQTNKC